LSEKFLFCLFSEGKFENVGRYLVKFHSVVVVATARDSFTPGCFATDNQ